MIRAIDFLVFGNHLDSCKWRTPKWNLKNDSFYICSFPLQRIPVNQLLLTGSSLIFSSWRYCRRYSFLLYLSFWFYLPVFKFTSSVYIYIYNGITPSQRGVVVFINIVMVLTQIPITSQNMATCSCCQYHISREALLILVCYALY